MAIRVLIVDDSAVVRSMLSRELGKDPALTVVGTAMDPLDASEKIEELNPDVMTLDVELPRMDGLTFLRGLMRHHPLPVIVVSAFTPKGSRNALAALEAGAVDIVPKPGGALSMRDMTAELTERIKAAAGARLNGTSRPQPAAQNMATLGRVTSGAANSRIIAIGGSTGATQALQFILGRLPGNMPPIVVVQHMPEGFTKAFADRLNTQSEMEVKEAEHNDAVLPGRCLIAPGNHHMEIVKRGAGYVVQITDGPRVCRQRPAAEVLFHSVAKHVGRNAIGVILTGMGNDGAEGMLAMKEAGAVNIAQDEASCVVFGMPKEAIAKGGVHHVVSLQRIPDKLHALLH